MTYVGLVLGALVVTLISSLWRVVVFLTWRPYAITRSLRKQGVEGPGYKFWSGSIEEIRSMKKAGRETVMDIHSHDITPRILPHYLKWLSQHGSTFLYWFGTQPRVCITDPELAKQILSNKFGFYTKGKPKASILAILGKGLIFTEGADWARHRRVVSAAFTMDKLKGLQVSRKVNKEEVLLKVGNGAVVVALATRIYLLTLPSGRSLELKDCLYMMTAKMAECIVSMLDTWHGQVIQAEGRRKEIEVNRQFQELTADVISHTAFGSSYVEGKEVFLAQKELQALAIATIMDIDIPGYKFLPTRSNLHKWKVEKRMNTTLMSIIQGRLDSNGLSYGNDLLGLMMEACRTGSEGMRMNMDEIIDECKTFFFAGHETTSHLLTWAMFLLSVNQEWQERLREEVLRECGMGIPDSDMLSKLKLVTMVVLEVLRLYCPVILMLRRADRDMNLGSLIIPKGTSLSIPIMIIHRSKDVWGADANEFNPLRFENGIAKAAKHPNALISFSIGPRACVGQNFAMMEAKMVMAMILQRFSFSLSPEYKHAPADLITLQPQFGLPIVLKPLHV